MAKSTTNSGSQNIGFNPSSRSALATELSSIAEPDPLQQFALGAISFIGRYRLFFSGLIALVILVGGGWMVAGMLHQRTETKAQNALFPFEKAYSEKKSKFDQARFAKMTGQTEGLKESEMVAASGDLQKDYGQTIDDLEAFAKSHLGTAASVQAAMMAAEARAEYHQDDKAADILTAVSKEQKTSTLLGALAKMASGNSLAAAGKCDEAIKTWEEILSTKQAGYLHGEAALRAGLCFQKSGDTAKATEMYRKATTDTDRTSTAQTAKSLLRALQVGS